MENYNTNKPSVHKILAHSYSVYFILFLIGVIFDLVFQFKIFTSSIAVPMGIVVLMFGSILVIWAQKTTRNLPKDNISKETFCQGPYCYTRHPTYLGLFFLLLGFGITINAFFVILSTIISFVISRFIFQNKEEKILTEKYGTHYIEYKKIVKF